MRLHLLFPIAAVLFISACTAPEKPVIPEWVQHPPEATATELYGVSVAHSSAEAVVSAAGGIASSVLNAANQLLEKETSDKRLRRDTASEMKAVLEKMDYSKISVKEEAPLEKETAVLVAMERSNYASQLKTRLQSHSTALEKAIAEQAHAADFTRLGTLGRAHEEQPLLLAEILLLETTDPAADTSAYRAQSKKIEDEYNALKFGMGVTVISDANAIVYVETLKQALRSEGINPSGKPAATLLLYADSEREHSGASYSVRTRLRIESTVKSDKVAESEHYLQARSAEGYGDARQKTAEVLLKMIKKDGLFHTLGF